MHNLFQIYSKLKRGELESEPVSLPIGIAIFGIEKKCFSSTKCWLDFQLLKAGIGTGVIVVIYPLSSSYI